MLEAPPVIRVLYVASRTIPGPSCPRSDSVQASAAASRLFSERVFVNPDTFVNPDEAEPGTVSFAFYDMRTAKTYHVKDAHIGETILEAAQRNNVPFDAFCGGIGGLEKDRGDGSACDGCHIYFPINTTNVAEPADPWESHTLETAVRNVRKNQSRLACMVEVTEGMNGFTFAMVPSDFPPEHDSWNPPKEF